MEIKDVYELLKEGKVEEAKRLLEGEKKADNDNDELEKAEEPEAENIGDTSEEENKDAEAEKPTKEEGEKPESDEDEGEPSEEESEEDEDDEEPEESKGKLEESVESELEADHAVESEDLVADEKIEAPVEKDLEAEHVGEDEELEPVDAKDEQVEAPAADVKEVEAELEAEHVEKETDVEPVVVKEEREPTAKELEEIENDPEHQKMMRDLEKDSKLSAKDYANKVDYERRKAEEDALEESTIAEDILDGKDHDVKKAEEEEGVTNDDTTLTENSLDALFSLINTINESLESELGEYHAVESEDLVADEKIEAPVEKSLEDDHAVESEDLVADEKIVDPVEDDLEAEHVEPTTLEEMLEYLSEVDSDEELAFIIENILTDDELDILDESLDAEEILDEAIGDGIRRMKTRAAIKNYIKNRKNVDKDLRKESKKSLKSAKKDSRKAEKAYKKGLRKYMKDRKYSIAGLSGDKKAKALEKLRDSYNKKEGSQLLKDKEEKSKKYSDSKTEYETKYSNKAYKKEGDEIFNKREQEVKEKRLAAAKDTLTNMGITQGLKESEESCEPRNPYSKKEADEIFNKREQEINKKRRAAAEDTLTNMGIAQGLKESEESCEPADKEFDIDAILDTPEVAEMGTEKSAEHIEDAKEESKDYKSLKEAAMLGVEYFTKDTYICESADMKQEKLLEQVSYLLARDNNDPLYEELLRTVVKAQKLTEAISDKYNADAASRVDTLLEGEKKNTNS